MSMRQARLDGAQRVADSTGNWDDSEVTDLFTLNLMRYSGGRGVPRLGRQQHRSDLFTLNLMRYSGVRCRILGTYQPPEDADAPWRFSSDVDNFYSGRGLKVYKPTGDDLEQIVNSAIRAEDGGQITKIGHVRYATATPADAAAVNIAAEDFVAQRTALFGMTRTGKSNTVKTPGEDLLVVTKRAGAVENLEVDDGTSSDVVVLK